MELNNGLGVGESGDGGEDTFVLRSADFLTNGVSREVGRCEKKPEVLGDPDIEADVCA